MCAFRARDEEGPEEVDVRFDLGYVVQRGVDQALDAGMGGRDVWICKALDVQEGGEAE